MTTPAERSRNFLFGIELLNDLCHPEKTPGVPDDVRARAKVVLRHFPTAEDIRAVVTAAEAPAGLRPDLFDAETLKLARRLD